jgi:hypothetical protein
MASPACMFDSLPHQLLTNDGSINNPSNSVRVDMAVMGLDNWDGSMTSTIPSSQEIDDGEVLIKIGM